MAIAEDASSPAVKTGTGTGNLVTDSFTPPANSLLVAMCNAGWGSSTTGISISDSLSGTWTTGAYAQGTGTTLYGAAKVAYRWVSSSAAMTVTASFTGLQGGRQLTVKVLTGAAQNQSGAASTTLIDTSQTTTHTKSITTTTTGSRVYGSVDCGDQNTPLSAAANTSIIQFTGNSSDTVCYASLKASADTGTPGGLTLGVTSTAQTYVCLALYEVLPSASGKSADAGTTSISVSLDSPSVGIRGNSGTASANASLTSPTARIGWRASADIASATSTVNQPSISISSAAVNVNAGTAVVSAAGSSPVAGLGSRINSISASAVFNSPTVLALPARLASAGAVSATVTVNAGKPGTGTSLELVTVDVAAYGTVKYSQVKARVVRIAEESRINRILWDVRVVSVPSEKRVFLIAGKEGGKE